MNAKMKVLIVGDTPALLSMIWKLATDQSTFDLTIVSLYTMYKSLWYVSGEEKINTIDGKIYRRVEDLTVLPEEKFDLMFIACPSFPLYTRTLEISGILLKDDAFIICDGSLGVSFEVFVNGVLPDHPVLTMFWDNDVKVVDYGKFECLSLSETLYLGFTSFPRLDFPNNVVMKSKLLITQHYALENNRLHKLLFFLNNSIPNLKTLICLNDSSEIELKTLIWKKCIIDICFDIVDVIFEDIEYGESYETELVRPIRNGLLKEISRIAVTSGCRDIMSLLTVIRESAIERLPRSPSKPLITTAYPLIIYNTFNNFQDYSLITILQTLLISDSHCLSNQSLTFLYSIYQRFMLLERNSLFFNRPDLSMEDQLTEISNNPDDDQQILDPSTFSAFFNYWKQNASGNSSNGQDIIDNNQHVLPFIRTICYEQFSRPFYNVKKYKEGEDSISRGSSIGSISSKTEDGFNSIDKEYFDIKFKPKSHKPNRKEVDKVFKDGDNIATSPIYQNVFLVDDSIKEQLLHNSKNKMMHPIRFRSSNPSEYEKSLQDHKDLLYSANMGGILKITTDRYGPSKLLKRPEN